MPVQSAPAHSPAFSESHPRLFRYHRARLETCPPAAGAHARGDSSTTASRGAVLGSLQRGTTTTTEVCDAHPHLLRAATFHGEPLRRPCPVCRRTSLAFLRYVYSDELGQYSGRLRTAAEVVEMTTEYGHLRVFVVEVCRSCAWNHLMASFVVGDGTPRRPPRRTPTVEDEYG